MIQKSIATKPTTDATSASQPSPAWRLIESAPRDGTPFLAWEGNERGPFKCWWHDDWPRGESCWMDWHDSEPAPLLWWPLDSPIRGITWNDAIEAAMNAVNDLRCREAGMFDEPHSGVKGESRLNALYDAFQLIRKLQMKAVVSAESSRSGEDQS